MEFLGSVGSFLTSNSTPINALLGAAGAGTNIYSGIQQMQQQNRLAGAQKYLTNLAENPAKMAAATAAYQQPLSAGLTADVANLVQGNLAERGLGSSPAAYTQQLTQALAPYIQSNQSTAYQALLQSLGLLGGQQPYATPFQDISKLLARLQVPGGSPTGSISPDFASMGPGVGGFSSGYPGTDTGNVDLSALVPTVPTLLETGD